MTYNVATATAREIIESRLGRPLGALADMPRDLRDALRLLGKEGGSRAASSPASTTWRRGRCKV